MISATQVQILNNAVCILHCSNTLGKYMNLTLLPPAMSK